VVEANGKKLVYVQNGNAFQPVEVTLGQTSGDMVEVKTGLFEGDLVVTQRAPQLYAQSLRGGSAEGKSQKAKGKSEQEGDSSSQNPKSQIPNSLPWWLVGTAGGVAIATGAFWLGRRSKPSSESFVYETSKGSKSPNGSAELPVSDRIGEFSVLAQSDRHHSENNHH
jgi:cobalt-zinc-cadmium efflux system membrane fusion protein